ELAHPNDRPTITSFFNPSWYTGAILSAGAVFATSSMQSEWSWRLPSALQALPSVLQLLAIHFCPESPRWLLSKDRVGDAFGVLSEYHGEGIRGNEFARIEYAQI
ncbi:general substrate transporter, partial [Neurospora tetraspora]